MDGELRTWHREQAVERFNRTWELLDRAERAEADDAELLEASFASRYHWGVIGGPANWAIGDSQIARVALGLGDLARWYARRTLAAVEAEGWTDFHLVTAHEVAARAEAAAGDAAARAAALERARRALAAIDDEDDRALLLEQIDTVPEA